MESSSIMSKSTPRRQLSFEESEDSGNDEEYGERLMDLTCLSDVSIIHSQMPNAMIPVIGIEFETEAAAWEFYMAYAKLVGFGVRRHGYHNDKYGNLVDRTFVCCAQGKRKPDKRDVYVKKPRPETRFGCFARMRVNKRFVTKFHVTEFVAEHTHQPLSPSKVHMLRCNRTITSFQAAEIDMVSSVGIAPKAGHDLMAKQFGGKDNVGFGAEDYKNYLKSKRTRFMKKGDTWGVLKYLQQMQCADSNFFYAIQVDEDDLLTNIFWSDSKMRTDFAIFGDVVSFDTTYRKNNEGRPIALFAGVNHHKQTVVFGAALLYNETIEAFEWLFDTFSRAMCGSKPKTILTDQDAAMANALTSTWPETQHRLCIWHIYQNAATHLAGVVANLKSFTYDFDSCIFDFEDEDEFLIAWDFMLAKHDLQENTWLKRLFDIRKN